MAKRGNVNWLSDSSVKDVDGQEDVLVGIENKSGSYIGLTGYNGPNNLFSGLQLKGGLWDKESIHFVIEDSPDKGDENEIEDGDKEEEAHVTPEPGSILLLGTGLLAVGGILRRRLHS